MSCGGVRRGARRRRAAPAGPTLEVDRRCMGAEGRRARRCRAGAL